MNTIIALPPFEIQLLKDESQEAAELLLKTFIQKTGVLEEASKIHLFCQRLRGVYSDWYDMTADKVKKCWNSLVSAFEEEFVRDTRTSLFEINHSEGEWGRVFFFRCQVAILRSKINFTEEEAVLYIIAKLNPPYKERIEGRKIKTYEELRLRLEILDRKSGFGESKKLKIKKECLVQTNSLRSIKDRVKARNRNRCTVCGDRKAHTH